MGSDLHMNPPSPPERVLAVRGGELAFYTRQTDGGFSDLERTNFTRIAGVVVAQGDPALVNDIVRFIQEVMPKLMRVVHTSKPLGEWMPRSVFDPPDQKRARLAKLETEAAQLRAELGE